MERVVRRLDYAIAILLAIFASSTISAAEITLYPDEKGGAAIIFVVGEIRPGDDEKFKKIAATTNNAIVSLNSAGGTIAAAMEIGKVIRLRDYTTAVDKSDSCASACALIWIAGAQRFIFEGGKVGFHASYLDSEGKQIETGVGNALVGHYLSQLGFGQRAVIFATAAPPDKILWLDSQNSISAGIEFVSVPNEKKRADEQANSTVPLPPVVTARQVETSPNSAATDDTWLASSNITIRNVDTFAAELKKKGFQANLTINKNGNPRILTGVGGNNIVLAFSSCEKSNCNYLEIIAFYTGIDEKQFLSLLMKYALEENFAVIYYNKPENNLYAYHYIILGNDGITSSNLIEKLSYFSSEFDKIGKILLEKTPN